MKLYGPGKEVIVPKGESDEHFRLKLEAMRKLRRRGYGLMCMEVTPNHWYDGIADVVAVDRHHQRVAVVEVKVSLSDFLRDARSAEKAEKARESYQIRVKAWRKSGCKGKPPSYPRRYSQKMTNANCLRGVTEAFVMTPPGMLKRADIPNGWGWMTSKRIQVSAPTRNIPSEMVVDAMKAVMQRTMNIYLYDLLGMRWGPTGAVLIGLLGE